MFDVDEIFSSINSNETSENPVEKKDSLKLPTTTDGNFSNSQQTTEKPMTTNNQTRQNEHSSENPTFDSTRRNSN